MRPSLLISTFLCALGPVFCLLLTPIQNAWVAHLKATTLPTAAEPVFSFAPVWHFKLGGFEANLAFAEVSAMLMYGVATVVFARFIRRFPLSKWYWPIWNALLLSGLALVNFGHLPAGFLAIAGFAILAKTYDARRQGLHLKEKAFAKTGS